MPGAGGTTHRDAHRMGSKYPRSLRSCLPVWTLMLEVAFILIFFFFTSYDMTAKNHKTVRTEQALLHDVTVMAALGLGFLTSSLWRYSWSSVAFNFFMLALGVQWAVLLDGFLEQPFSGKVVIKQSRIQQATMSAMSVLISAGAILGKANLLQLLVMVLIEVTAFGAMRMMGKQFLFMDDHLSMMHIHVFAAYFGITVAWCFSRPLPKGAEEKDQRATSPSLFAMLGTLFLWMFWPSFNSMLLTTEAERKNAVLNTYYALAVSAVTAISLSALAHPQGKINMTHIHNAVLAGGVAVGAPSQLISSPWLAMVLGFMAALITIGGAKCLPLCFGRMLNIHDTSGVLYTFGLPGLLGGITNIILILDANWTKTFMFYQELISTGALSLSIAMGLAAGLLTGLLLNLKIWRAPHVAKYFDDQAFWEFPHLAVGF
ncbi:blood group Rh(CE) polypeptide [Pteronotus mesoamericanus]|uniref:blood group Rh(CE) polypeptide n=1 Tax=Pteronotus mesoamericanus TaxID=1884717 RepID=UPI0023EC5649|nr:blood group Rh(CE) polypeptide [Pteronotus parnellii mesoamericanus]